MDICLLCLELKHGSVEFLKIEAITLIEKESVAEVIEKHLWPMESINSNSWICKSCWQILFEFHKFYQRIEEAHEDLANLLDDETPVLMQQSKSGFQKHIDQDLTRTQDNMCSSKRLNLHSQSQENVSILTKPELQTNVGHQKVESTSNVGICEAKQLKQKLRKLPIPMDQSQESPEVNRNLLKHLSEMDTIDNTKLPSDEEPMTEDEDMTDDIKDPLKKHLPIFEKANVSKNQILDVNISADVDEIFSSHDINLKVHHQDVSKCVSGTSHSEFQEDDLLHSKTDTKSNDSSTISISDESKPFLDIRTSAKMSEDQIDELIEKHITLTCEICQDTMKTFRDLSSHYRSEHNQAYIIRCCKKTFRRRSTLTDHILWHLDPEYFKCKRCGKLLADRRCLNVHMANTHENRIKCHVCDICGKSFANPGVLRHHKKTHLPEDEKKFRCTQCDKNFGSKYLLTSHVCRVHTKNYIKICEICAKEFRVKKKFERHMQEHEGVTETAVSCDVCGFKSVDQASLKRHKAAQHPEGGKTEHKCHLCAKISPSLRAHKMHVRYKHELSNNFKCSICHKAFKRSYTLSEHMATHTQEALYVCPHCPQTFKSNGNMHKHRKIVHPIEWEKARRDKFSNTSPPPTNQKAATY